MLIKIKKCHYPGYVTAGDTALHFILTIPNSPDVVSIVQCVILLFFVSLISRLYFIDSSCVTLYHSSASVAWVVLR